MAFEASTERILIEEKPEFSGKAYLKSLPGILRLLNVAFGILALSLILPGFPSDFTDEDLEEFYERKHKAHYRLTWDGRFDSFYHEYGAGYVYERPNIAQLICIVICLAYSGLHLLILVSSPNSHLGSGRAWNRYLNLSASILQGVGFMNGVFGVLLFRSYCCHVNFSSNDRHESELEGYFREPCLCYFTPKWEGYAADSYEYTTRFYNDVPDEISYHTVLPHHFIPHTISLCFMALNMVTFIIGSVKI